MKPLLVPDDFWIRVRRGATDECWPWLGRIEEGKGRVGYQGRRWPASRLAYTLTYGPVPATIPIGHSCGTGTCCNPSHLVLGQLPGQRHQPEDFWARVQQGSETACWPWQGGRLPAGYGMVKYHRTQWKAHRLAWTLANGPIPDGLCVRHDCDNPPCCNPAHLRLGTTEDNIQDRDGRGRTAKGATHAWARNPHKIPRGEELGTSVLTEDAVRQIRAAAGTVTNVELAHRWGVTPACIGYVIRRVSWRHVL